jgi:hypothetical protein
MSSGINFSPGVQKVLSVAVWRKLCRTGFEHPSWRIYVMILPTHFKWTCSCFLHSFFILLDNSALLCFSVFVSSYSVISIYSLLLFSPTFTFQVLLWTIFPFSLPQTNISHVRCCNPCFKGLESLLCIQKSVVKNPSKGTRDFEGFTQSLQIHDVIVLQITQWRFPSASSTIHSSLINLLRSATRS